MLFQMASPIRSKRKQTRKAESAENGQSSDSVSVSSDNEPTEEDTNQDPTGEDASQVQMEVEAK